MAGRQRNDAGAQGELIMLTNDNLYKLPTLSLRFFMVYGPRNPAQGAYAIVTGKFIDRLKHGQPLIIEGDGQNFRDFVHVDDVARALILEEVADLISADQQHVAARRNDLLGTLADTCRARRMLNFRTRHDFIATMKDTLETLLPGWKGLTGPERFFD
eukprot:Skav215340  [mRNA]  locus=scaffold1391:232487:233904:- [translate_table: standard]